MRADRPSFRWRTRLDGAFYHLRLVWISRVHRWILDIADAANNPIALGIGVTVGCDLLAPLSAEGRPPGQLFATDDSGAGRNPTRNGWRGDFRLIYRPAADVAAAFGTDDEVR